MIVLFIGKAGVYKRRVSDISDMFGSQIGKMSVLRDSVLTRDDMQQKLTSKMISPNSTLSYTI
jgi:hypothetical protein